MNLFTKDLRHIGHTAHEHEGCLVILCENNGIERLLLREILHLTGYKITAVCDAPYTIELDDGTERVKCDVAYYTDFPWDDFFNMPEDELWVESWPDWVLDQSSPSLPQN